MGVGWEGRRQHAPQPLLSAWGQQRGAGRGVVGRGGTARTQRHRTNGEGREERAANAGGESYFSDVQEGLLGAKERSRNLGPTSGGAEPPRAPIPGMGASGRFPSPKRTVVINLLPSGFRWLPVRNSSRSVCVSVRCVGWGGVGALCTSQAGWPPDCGAVGGRWGALETPLGGGQEKNLS